MQILVNRAGQQYGPYSEGEVREYVQSGRLSGADLAWTEGRPNWVPLSELVVLGTPAATPAPPSLVKQPAAPPLFPNSPTAMPSQTVQTYPSASPAQGYPPAPAYPPQTYPPHAPDGSVALYNPNAAASWSLLFSPAFGAFLHARNWRALGDPGRARTNTIWFYAVIAVIVLLAFIPTESTAPGRLVGLGLLLGWWFSQGKAQIDLVKNSFPGGYPKRSLLAPVLTGLAILFVFCAIVFTVAFAAAFASPEKLAVTYADTIKPSILTAWHKKPELKDATIQQVTLTPVNGSRTEFKGTVDATINGEKITFPVEASVEPGTTNVSWKVLPAN